MNSIYDCETIQFIQKGKINMPRYKIVIDWLYRFTVGMHFSINIFYIAVYNLNRFINKYEIINDALVAFAIMYLSEVFILHDICSTEYKYLLQSETIDEFNKLINFIFYGLNYNMFYITSYDFIKLEKDKINSSIYGLAEYINLISTLDTEIYYYNSSNVAKSSVIISKFIIVDSTFSTDGKYFIERIEYLINSQNIAIKKCMSIIIKNIFNCIDNTDKLLILDNNYINILQENKDLLIYLDKKLMIETKYMEPIPLLKINYDSMEELIPAQTLKKVNSGTYGDVFLMNKIHILKKHKIETVISQCILRESAIISILNKFPHYNLIHGARLLYNNHNYYTVMPYYGTPIKTDLNLDVRITTFQILSAVNHLHNFGIIHRDITMNNLLIKNGVITLIDYGMSDFVLFENTLQSPVCTLTYRPIENILGYNKFGKEQDIWSVGCVMLFLLCKSTLMFGYHEIEQIFSIYSILGFPKTQALQNLPHFKNTYPKWNKKLKEYLDNPLEYNIINQMLNYNFYKRISAYNALNHTYFR